MLTSILMGILLATATIAIHAIGTSGLIDYLRNREDRFQSRFGEIKVLSLTAIALLLLHTAQVLTWATAYLLVIDGVPFSSFEDAAYFSAVTFASLGYGDIVLSGSWRMLSAFQAMTGLLVFGWSTALLFAIVQRVWQRKYKSSACVDSSQEFNTSSRENLHR